MLRNTAILEILYATGIRLSELIGLNVGSINEKEMLIKVLGKGNKVRIIPFGKKAKKAIYKYLIERNLTWNASSNTPLFCSWSEKRIAKRTVQGKPCFWERILDSIVIPSSALISRTIEVGLLPTALLLTLAYVYIFIMGLGFVVDLTCRR